MNIVSFFRTTATISLSGITSWSLYWNYCVFCREGMEFLNIISMNCVLKTFKFIDLRVEKTG
jgi:hypothetical protein